jgi:hypothetical protein
MTYLFHNLAAHHVPFNLRFKAVTGFALAAVTMVGLVISLIGHQLPFWAGVISGLAGGVTGLVVASRIKDPSSSSNRR